MKPVGSDRTSRLTRLLAGTLLTGLLPAQEVLNAEELKRRFAEGSDLIQLRYRRADDGRMQFVGPGADASDWRFLFGEDESLGKLPVMGAAGWLAAAFHGSADLLGMTEAARHFTHAGIGSSDAELLRFLATPAAKGPGARVDLLDRLLAIDVLRRSGTKDAVAALDRMAAQADLAPVLRNRAQDAAARLQGKTVPARTRLDPAKVLLPATADVFVMLDHGRWPELQVLTTMTRLTAMVTGLRLIQMLKAPRPEDVAFAQRDGEIAAELPFELARRIGNFRLDHTVLALTVRPQDSPPAAWSLQSTARFETDRLVPALTTALAGMPDVRAERRDEALQVTFPGGEVTIRSDGVASASTGVRAQPRPDLVARLLAPGPALRLVVPANSKLWLLAAAAVAKLPPIESGELTLSLQPKVQMRATLELRSEEAAEELVERIAALQKDLEQRRRADPDLAQVIIPGKETVVAEGPRVVVTSEFEWKQLDLPRVMLRLLDER